MMPCGVWAEELLVGGQAVGIEISSDGVIVSGFSTVETDAGAVSPAEEAGFRPGDLIVEINGETIRTAEDLIAAVARLGGNEASVAVQRGGETVRLRVRPALSPGGQWLLGMWLRDGVSGVGTITFMGEERPSGRLRFLIVAPDCRGIGLGKEIVQTALDWAKELGYTHIWLTTHNILTTARAMYVSMGFRKTDECPADEVKPGIREETYVIDL